MQWLTISYYYYYKYIIIITNCQGGYYCIYNVALLVFKVAKCPAGCDTSHLQVDHDCGTGIAKFNKKCSLKCPGAKKPVKTKCIWSKTQRKATFSKRCPSSG